MEPWTIAADKLTSHAGWKMIAAAAFWLLVRHMLLFSVFAVLVFFDALTKWLAISAMMEKARGEESDLWSAFTGIPKAFSEGAIQASAMKRMGAGKLLVYQILMISAAVADGLLLASGQPAGAVPLVLSYLSGGELLSILEHLADAGAPGMEELKIRIQKLLK